jgi:group I intron endonuclease
MERKKELKQQYKEMPIKAGVYKIQNKQTGKCLVGSTNNLKTLNGVRFMLKNDTHTNKQLQEDWLEAGEGQFEIEILEELKELKDPMANPKKELELLEEKWLDQLKPYGDKGYNIKK